MPSRPPVTFPAEQRLLVALGERLRLARKRRGLTTTNVSKRAGISRTTLYHVEAGDAAVTLGSYVRVLAALGLDGDLELVAADDELGRRLQDLELRRKTASAPAPPTQKRQRKRSSDSEKA